MPYSPLSLSEAHRRRAKRLSSFSSRSASLSRPERDENEDELEEQA
jgi:hypothetical protein